jgi:glycine cleavage system aminomethyltransferase T/glycine/D-amino acid oxidase-like deaminating enzyme
MLSASLGSVRRAHISRLGVQLSTLARDKVPLPSQARVVVIGGGIIGNSIAYHLGLMGMKDVVLLEQKQLTSGTTWHAAGLMVTFGSKSETSTELRKYTKQLYASLEKETGQSTGFKPCGFIELAANEDRLQEYRRIASFNRRCGVDVQEITPEKIKELFPLCKTDDILAGFYVSDDGRVNPVDASMALAKGAKMRGVRIFEGERVARLTYENSRSNLHGMYENRNRVTGVEMENGHRIQAEYVVNCTGMWARQLGESAGITIPNQAAEHYYLITDAMKDVDPNWPVIEDPHAYTYIRPEAGGLMVGLFEGKAASWNVKRIPDNFSFGEIEPDWERMAPYVEAAMNRVPATYSVGVKKFFCGPESFTPDLGPIVGPAPEMDNLFVAAGLNSIGILTGGGIGRTVANWIVTGKPDVDITGMNIDRFHKYQTNPLYRAQRVEESLGLVYKTHYPYKGKESARGAKFTPFYHLHQQQGAFFREISGWEIPDWYLHSQPNSLPSGERTVATLAEAAKKLGSQHVWGRPPWFAHWEAEHRACRERVMLLDMSFMSKFMVIGKDAGACLNRLCTADVDGPVDTITYCQMLNEEGKLEADITVTKISPNKFMVIATDTMHRHVETHLQRYLDPTGEKRVVVTDVTGAYAQLNVQGPLSRDLMRAVMRSTNGLTEEESAQQEDIFSEANFPFRHAREIPIGLARVRCARITYVGELGYELHVPVEQALHVYQHVTRCAEEGKFGMLHGGLKALASLRLEKGYRDYGHDMDNTDTLLEMGLSFTADFDKPGGFMGKEAVIAQRDGEQKIHKGLKKRLVNILVLPAEGEVAGQSAAMMYHGETIFRDGECVGDVRIGSYGHTLGGPVGLAHICPEQPTDPKAKPVIVNKTYLETGKWEVEINAKRYPIQLALQPLYDPKNLKIKGSE